MESQRKVPKEHAMDFKNNHGLDYFLECSAKADQNTKDVFIEATKILYADYLKYRDAVSITFNLAIFIIYFKCF